MIVVQNVYKKFGNITALHDVSFEIGKGEIIGFLGQNGAGKTTLMRLLTGYLPATSGRVSVAGYDLQTQSLQARRKLGYLPETPPLYPEMTVSEYLRYAALLKEIPGPQVKLEVDRVLSECELQKVKGRVLGHLSKGFKQRVGIAQAIINNPDVLILDEPTNGLDPVQIQHVRRLIKNVERQRTVILSTHVLSEIELLAKRVIIIQAGRILVDKPLTDLLNSSAGPGQAGLSQGSLEKAFLDIVRGEHE